MDSGFYYNVPLDLESKGAGIPGTCRTINPFHDGTSVSYNPPCA